MALGWNEIKERAVKFSNEWAGTSNEEADAKPFLVEFFNVFGISSRKVATFEHKVKRSLTPNPSPGGEGRENYGYIDLLWKGTIVIEMKSRGKNLDKAYQQAKDYLPGLKQHELPKYILVSDFENFRLYDLEENKETDFQLKDFVNHVHLFGFIAGYQKRVYKDEDPVNIEAAYLMGKLHDSLKEAGYTGHELEKYLVRLLFCLFAEDTTIFEKRSFQEYIENKTNEDGTDLGMHIAQLFQVLNTPLEKRQKTLDESINAFPYVNGHLFEEQLSFASFNSKMRQSLLECCYLDWSKISPAIFGSMFQSVMDEKQRRNLGAHYTSEKNILKLIKPLFLDKLWKEYDKVKNNANELKKLQRKIASLRFLDPACGCGNFLVITYRELRLLELAILKELQKGQRVLDLESLMQCNVDRFYGIEYEEFPAQIAQLALWLIDHQMNMLCSQEFGEYFVRLPLKKSAKIVNGNALRTDWDSMIELLPWEGKTDTEKYDYILGNPPFIGHHLQTKDQKTDLHLVLTNIDAAGVMDYVSAWYIKAAQYIQKHNNLDSNQAGLTKVAFVSTNSIVQGEQVGILWRELFNKYNIKIHFAHQTFKWNNEAKGIAAVYCVIIGFSNFDLTGKKLFIYDDIRSEPHEVSVNNINSYLVEAKDILIDNKSKPLCQVPSMMYGNKPTDGGNFILTDKEKNELVTNDPNSKPFIKPLLSAREFLHNEKRWCIWLVNVDPHEIKNSPLILERVNKVKEFRLSSVAESTRNYPYHTLFRQVTQPKNSFILVPRVSSENRKYIPMGFFDKDNIVSDTCMSIPNATLYNFGILTSEMHMSWVRYTCGRLKSDFRYSKDIVYNNYPWPENLTDKQKEAIEKAAQKVLDVRTEFQTPTPTGEGRGGASLADLYDPLTMPPTLVKAHNELDKAVDLAYRPQPFINETKRIEFLFDLYDKYTAGLFAGEGKKRQDRR